MPGGQPQYGNILFPLVPDTFNKMRLYVVPHFFATVPYPWHRLCAICRRPLLCGVCGGGGTSLKLEAAVESSTKHGMERMLGPSSDRADRNKQWVRYTDASVDVECNLTDTTQPLLSRLRGSQLYLLHWVPAALTLCAGQGRALEAAARCWPVLHPGPPYPCLHMCRSGVRSSRQHCGRLGPPPSHQEGRPLPCELQSGWDLEQLHPCTVPYKAAGWGQEVGGWVHPRLGLAAQH